MGNEHFHPQLRRPGAFLDVVTQEMTVESRPLHAKKESLRSLSVHQKGRKNFSNSPRSSKQKEVFHSDHSTKDVLIRAGTAWRFAAANDFL